MKIRVWTGIFAVMAFITAFLLFIDFAGKLKDYGPVDAKADAIVVLTGGKGRADEGLKLLRNGAAEILILSGVNEDADLDAIYLYKVKESNRPRIILEKNSRSTYQNAVEVARIMEERGLKSMVLITSAYHMKRAEFIFKNVLPQDIKVIPYTVSTPNFDEDKWWSGRSLVILFVEFLKYCWFVVRFGVG